MDILKKTKLYVLILLFGASSFAWYAVFRIERSNGKLFVDVFDVGQGDAIFFEAGDNQVLVDGGPDNTVLTRLGNVMPFWDHSIDLLVLTHAHVDHVTGLIEVLKRYDVGMVLESGEQYQTPEYEEWHRIIKEKNIPVVTAKKGEVVHIGDGVVLDVLSPFENANGISFKNPHDAMVVTKLIFNKTSFLLMGDAEKMIEYRLVQENPSILKSDVLKIGHHGSKTSSSEEFLFAVSPDIAVISLGKKNRYGHPHQEVLDRLRSFGVEIFRTDVEGDVKFVSDGLVIERK